jgi:LmbE family N-acetylglucosaminyl deacetylase
MKFTNSNADIYVPDGIDVEKALERTTHLAIGAHQDDLEILAYHGIAECFGRTDRWFTGVVLTNGAGSPRTGIYGAYSDKDMQEVRRREQRQAAALGEYACQIQLMYTSSAVKTAGNNNAVKDLQAILEIARPGVLYLHNPADKHDTHVATLLRSLEAVRAIPAGMRPQKAYGVEVWRDLDWLVDEDKQVLPVDKYPNLAAALLGIFDSQISGGKRYDLATAGRRMANATYYATHETDVCSAMTYALDLTPLIQNEDLAVRDYILGKIGRFQAEILSRLERLG